MVAIKSKKRKVRARRMTGIRGAPTTPGRSADMYFQHEVDQKQIIELVKSWIKSEYPKESSDIILKQPDWKFGFPHWACIIHTNDESRMAYLKSRIDMMLDYNSIDKPQKINKAPVRDVVGELIAEIEEVVDNQDDEFDFYQFARLKNINKNQIQNIIAYYRPQYEELIEAKEGSDPQLKEAYGYLKRRGLNNRIAFFKKMIDELERQIQNKKVVRKPRKPKVKSAGQIVKGLNYLTESNELKIVSINPESILDKTQLWVYNVKYEKLTLYRSMEGGFKVKGSTLMNFDPETSICKKLRKPEEQLNSLLKLGKVGLRKFMDTLTTKPSPFTGRINNHTLLLKVT